MIHDFYRRAFIPSGAWSGYIRAAEVLGRQVVSRGRTGAPGRVDKVSDIVAGLAMVPVTRDMMGPPKIGLPKFTFQASDPRVDDVRLSGRGDDTQVAGPHGHWLVPWVETYGDRLLQFTRAYTNNVETARDIVQETFIRLFHHHLSRPNRTIRPGWLYTVARRLAIDHYRKVQRETRAIGQQEWAYAQPDLSWDVEAVLDRLPDLDRELLFLFYYQEWSISELARHYAIPENTVKSRLHRARNKFHRVWKEEPS